MGIVGMSTKAECERNDVASVKSMRTPLRDAFVSAQSHSNTPNNDAKLVSYEYYCSSYRKEYYAVH